MAATADGLRFPDAHRENEPEYVKKLVNAPEGFEFTCFLAIDYPAENAHVCKQKEINVNDRIHLNKW